MSNENPVPFSTAYRSNRIKLIDSIPLNLPLCISIEPTNICNFKCLMCWQSTDEYRKAGNFGFMDMKLFYKVIDDIKSLCDKFGGKIKLMKLYSGGEPLLHKNITEMVHAIKTANICNELEITSNVSLLTEEMAKSFVDDGLDYFRASIYSVVPKEQLRITQSKVLPDEIHDRLGVLYKYRNEQGKKRPFICAKTFYTNDEEQNLFKNMYADVSDEQIIEFPWNIPSLEEKALDKLYGGNEQGKQAENNYLDASNYKVRKACRYPFTHITIRSNGDAVVCCTDWSRDTLFGNVNEQSIYELWNSKKLYNFRVMMIKTKGVNHPICSTCEMPYNFCPEDDIDTLPVNRLNYLTPEDLEAVKMNENNNNENKLNGGGRPNNVLVTGASRGIGKTIAYRYAKEGYKTITPTRAELNLLDYQSVDNFIENNKHERIDIIINNAGINDINLVENVTDKEISDMLTTNLISPLRLLRGFIGQMKENKFGRIVNIGSVWAVVSKPGRSVYSVSKNGLHGITNTLALELAPYNILVNTVCPGFVMTELTIKNNTPEQIRKLEENIPLGRLAKPEEIADLVYFLGSEQNTYLTGQKIIADGGYTVQ